MSSPTQRPRAVRRVQWKGWADLHSSELEIFGAWFPSHTDTRPDSFEMSWDEFCQVVTSELHIRENKFDNGPGFSLARFVERDGTINRDNLHVDVLSGIALDFDEAFDPGDIFAKLEDVAWLAYTTFKHHPSAPRWRVIIPFSTPIPARLYKRVRTWLLNRINGNRGTNKADEQAKAVSNFYFLPGCPAAAADLAEFKISEGVVLDVPAISDFKTGTPQARILGTKVDWTWLKEKMRSYKDPHVRNAFRAVLKGKPYAEKGERDTLMLKMCGALAGWALACEPAELATIFAKSIAAMEEIDPDDPPPDLDNIESKIARSQTSLINNAREENAEASEQAKAIPLLDPVEVEQMEQWAIDAGLPDGDTLRQHLLLFKGTALWMWRTDLGTWGGPLTLASAQAAARQELGAIPGVDTWTRKADGDLRLKVLPELLQDYGRVFDSTVADLRIDSQQYDPVKRQLRLVGAYKRKLEPQEDETVDAWMRAIGGRRAEQLLDWVAGLTWLHRPNSVLFIKGDPGVGKGLFVRGLSRVWEVDQPTMMKRIVDNFNDELRRCPLVLIDEGRWSKFVDVTTILRELVTQPSRTVNQKFQDPLELVGYLRFIVTANNFNIFANDQHSLTPADRDAIAERFLEIDPDVLGAQDILNSLDPEERDGLASEDRIARHALWLAQTREVKSPGRFIVPGEKDGRFAMRIITEDHSYGAWTVEWLARYLSEPIDIERSNGHLVYRDRGLVIVSPEAVINTFEKTLKNKKPPQSLEISNALRSLSTGQLVAVPGDRGVLGFQIMVEEVAQWAKEKGIGNPARIHAHANEERSEQRQPPKVLRLPTKEK